MSGVKAYYRKNPGYRNAGAMVSASREQVGLAREPALRTVQGRHDNL
jgi:hypothetical protein